MITSQLLPVSRCEEIILPSEPEIERAIIGAIIRRENPAQALQVRRELHGSAFYLPSHREVFECLVEMAERGDAVNLLTVARELRIRGSSVREAEVAALIDGVPHLSDLSTEVRIVKEAATRREIIRLADSLVTKAQDRDVDVRDLSRTIAERMAGIGQASGRQVSLATSWEDFKNEVVREGEVVGFGLERRESGCLIALPNGGKSTITLNALLSMACGRQLAPVVVASVPRKVLLIDGESSRAKLQRDVKRMMEDFTGEETHLVAGNLHIICEAEIDGEPLNLTREDHLAYVMDEADKIKPDFIVIDTQAALFPVCNENDNAEQQRKVWRPMQKLARKVDAAVLVLHHIGKRSDDEQSNDRKFYRGRGASAGGGAVRTAWTLTQDPLARGFFTLLCTKMKGQEPEETRFQLGSDRWMHPMGALEAPKTPESTPVSLVVSIVTQEMKAGEIKALLRGKLSERSVEAALTEAHRAGKLRYVRKGLYAPLSAEPATLPLAEVAEVAEVAEEGKKDAIFHRPQNPQAPKGTAEVADDVTVREISSLRPKSQNQKNGVLRKIPDAKKVIEFPPQSLIAAAEIADDWETLSL